eukprot:7847989-Ditylum_brightwellii.AAC.1
MWRCSWSQFPLLALEIAADRGTTPWKKGEPSNQQDATATLSCVCCQASQNSNEWVTLGQDVL